MTVPVTAITDRLRTALESGETPVPAGLLHPEVRLRPWRPDDPAHPETRGRAQAVAWYRQRLADGIRAEVDETFTFPDAVVLGLRLRRPDGRRPQRVYRLFRVRGGQITVIRDFTDRADALSCADQPAPRP